MLLDRTESAQSLVWTAPNVELGVNEFDELIERGEVPIVQPEFTQELPDALNRVELRAVRRKKEQEEARLLPAAPLGVQNGMVIFGVVDDDNDAPAGAAACPAQLAQECPAGLSIKAPSGLEVTKRPSRMRTAPK